MLDLDRTLSSIYPPHFHLNLDQALKFLEGFCTLISVLDGVAVVIFLYNFFLNFLQYVGSLEDAVDEAHDVVGFLLQTIAH